MKHLYLYDDFIAAIRILTCEEGGRQTPAHNGVRWDFSYADDASGMCYMIWPDFYDANGDSLAGELPVNVFLPARMVIVVDEMRIGVHRARLRPGIRFHCHEGARIVAEGRVERISGLFAQREHNHI